MPAPKYRKAPDGEWLGFPELRIEDIQHESFQETKHIAQSLVDNRKGRIHMLMEHDSYQRFLNAVRKKYGNTSAFSVEKAAEEALKAWTEGVETE
jgi:hypothetical protein